MSLSFETPPRFYDGVNQFLSAADLRTLRRDAMVIDALSYRPLAMVDQGAIFHGASPGNNPANPPFRIRAGYFCFRSGCTTFTITGRAVGNTSLSIRLYFDGMSVDLFAPTGGDFTRTVTISSRGYSDGQVVRWDLNCEGSAAIATGSGTFTVREAYISPIEEPGWQTPPTFTAATINEANLNKLGDCLEWLYERIAATPYGAQRMPMFMLGSFRTPPDPRSVYRATVCRGYSNEILRIYGQVTNLSSPGLVYKVFLNNSATATATSSALGIGTHNLSIPVSLSGFSIGQAIDVNVVSETTDSGIQANWKFSRWRFLVARSEYDENNYPYATPPSTWDIGNATTGEAMASWLNSLSTIATNTKNRIDGLPHIFNRIRSTMRWPDYDDNPENLQAKRFPISFVRTGKRLIVRGKDVSLAWGAVTIPMADNGLSYEEYTFAHSENVVPSDKIDTREVALDTIDGLYPGTLYYLIGDVHYAEERLE